MKHSAMLLPNEEKIDRRLTVSPASRGSVRAKRFRFGTVALVACCLVAAAVVVGAVLRLPAAEETALPSSPALEAMPPPSYFIWGYTKDSEGSILGECTVTITNPRLGESRTVVSLADGRYMYDLANMATENEEYYADGDEILVEAVKDTLVGSSTGYVDTAAGNNLQLDVILEGGAEPFEVTITLTVTDNDGMTSTWSETLMLYP